MLDNKFFLFGIFLCVFNGITFSQNRGVKDNDDKIAEKDTTSVSIIQPFFDADSVLIGKYFYTDNKLDSTCYLKPDGKLVKVEFELPEYKGGYDSLKTFFSEKFQTIVTENDSVYLDALSLTYILLENGKLTDVQIGKRIGYGDETINYDEKIKEIIYQTNGNWIIDPEKENTNILFVYLFQLN
ncbi:hypothetical protein D0T49_06825 [Paludibacter sp. 221]|uniref:hypothetical protein n=1 Tax=Paludibacter sp. 221 TaxID=2302939 RepID=UPI0013D4AE46|nr:hypothetical protein [Paludibacter sp. 221]NDV46757.1 hypothetical protein [Paludibacter sp. 221]